MAAIPFIDLDAQRRRLADAIDEAVLRVVHSGQYVLGPEVQQLEAELSAYCGAKHTVTCANGTDALILVLRAKGIRPGDAVLCPSFTFAATAEAVVLAGATPIFVDVHEDTFNLDPTSLEQGIETARSVGLRPTAVIAVDLFGQPADYDAIEPTCQREDLWLLCDAAQSFGASYKGRKVGTLGLATTTSFFPAKPLGCYGDGGAIFTDDDELAAALRSIRVHGQGIDKYHNNRIGMNSRLDTLQAAILLEKLKIFTEELAARDVIANRYSGLLKDVASVPDLKPGCTSSWAQYTLRLDWSARDHVQRTLAEAGVPTAVYYSKPLHQQTAYRAYLTARTGLPISERLAQQVVSLPMHPYLGQELQERIVALVRRAIVSSASRQAG